MESAIASNPHRSMVRTNPLAAGKVADHSIIDLLDASRLAVVSTPRGRGTSREQAQEAFAGLQAVLEEQPHAMFVTNQTVFMREPEVEGYCRELLQGQYGSEPPPTNFVQQAPCDGSALTIEAWTIGGKSVRVERQDPHTLAVEYHGIRWVYCAGIQAPPESASVYAQASAGLARLNGLLNEAGSGFAHVVRTWFYLGDITGTAQNGTLRYHELNRARSDFYHDIRFCHSLLEPQAPRAVYPASTGIGTLGQGLELSCLTLQTERKDAFLLPLENPQQTPAYAYHPKYSHKSPKFTRAMALVLEDYVTTWISGTASVVNSESCHEGKLEKQTEQTIDNIERLIAPENFSLHGAPGVGASLHDLAKIRVYLKRGRDFSKCRAICQRRFGAIPTIYAVADICRPELLVEIEGVAFSKRSRAVKLPEQNGGS